MGIQRANNDQNKPEEEQPRWVLLLPDIKTI